jgi:predicted nucleic acid-binding protein
MRIVADTNTVLSGLLWRAPPRRLLDLNPFQNIPILAPAEALRTIEARK